MIEQGYCTEHISQILGIPYGSVNLYLRDNGFTKNYITDKLTPFQFKMVIDRYKSGMTIAESIRGFDIDYKTATYWIKKLGVKVRVSSDYERQRKFETYSEHADKVVETYLSGKSLFDTAKQFSMDPSRVDEIVSERNVKRTKTESCLTQLGVTYNEDAFSDFNDELAAYFYGFILADGNLSKELNKISVTLKTSDSIILEKLKDYVSSGRSVYSAEVYDKRTNKIYNRSSISFQNQQLADKLIAQGLAPTKSGKEVLPKFDWLHNRHFWRGVIDGDGWVVSKTNTIGIVGSLEVVNGFLEFVEENIGLVTKRTPLVIVGKTTDYARVALTGIDAKNTMQFLYQDSEIYLPRKYKEASKFFR